MTRLHEASRGRTFWTKMMGVATFLLVWNPDNWPWPDSDYDSTVALTDAGMSIHGRWSVGFRRRGIGPGVRAPEGPVIVKMTRKFGRTKRSLPSRRAAEGLVGEAGG